MIDCVAVCGDSFGVGSGLPLDSCYENSFGGIVAKKLQLPLKVYARSGCCNYIIYLQVKKIIEQYHNNLHKPLVLITITHHSRIVFPFDSTRLTTNVDLSNVEYKSYAPYSDYSKPQRPLEFNLLPTPNLTSETISNLNLCLAGSSLKNNVNYKDILDDKWRAISLYFKELYDDTIKQDYDCAIINLMHQQLLSLNIPHIFLGYKVQNLEFINSKNFADVHWGKLSSMYPDVAKSGHCNEIGHQHAADIILEKIQNLI